METAPFGPRIFPGFQRMCTLLCRIFQKACSVMPDVPSEEKIPAFSFKAFDCHNIPSKLGTFDLVIANHVLFYCEDVGKVCQGVSKILNPGEGSFAAPTAPATCGKSACWSSPLTSALSFPRTACTSASAGKTAQISFPRIFPEKSPGSPMRMS